MRVAHPDECPNILGLPELMDFGLQYRDLLCATLGKRNGIEGLSTHPQALATAQVRYRCIRSRGGRHRQIVRMGSTLVFCRRISGTEN
jgi:hypothetical protein